MYFQIAGEPYVISHSSSASFHEDGFVQTYELSTKPLSKYSSVFISISARNSVRISIKLYMYKEIKKVIDKQSLSFFIIANI
jgi:hypothetical protein